MGRARSNRPKYCPYVGKGGLKLEFALEHFEIDVSDRRAADLGCHIGGFTDCMLQRGAARVCAVDTGYGILEWKLRQDPRVTVIERTNVLHWVTDEKFDIVACDLGWTRQELLLPVVGQLLKPDGHALTLVKPQYEAPKEWVRKGVLAEEYLPQVLAAVRTACPDELLISGEVRSPLIGSGGNTEYWLLVRQHKTGLQTDVFA